jgi:hypothetical protein
VVSGFSSTKSPVRPNTFPGVSPDIVVVMTGTPDSGEDGLLIPRLATHNRDLAAFIVRGIKRWPA